MKGIMKVFIISMLLVLCSGFAICMLASGAYGATYYVSISGVNSSDCGDQGNACASVQYVLDNKVYPGDTIKVEPGNYYYGGSYYYAAITNGARHNNITLTAADPANRPYIQGTNDAWGLILIGEEVSGVTVSYLRLAHSTSRISYWKNGVVQVRGNPATVDNNEIMNGYNGISVETSKNITISNNKIHTMGKVVSCVPYEANGSGVCIGIYKFVGESPATGWDEKIYIYNNEGYDCEDGLINVQTFYKYIEIAYNDFHDNFEDGLDWKDTQYVRIHHNKLHGNCGNGIGSNFTYPSYDFEIWANEIYNNNNWGIIIQGSNQSDWLIHNNLIYNNCRNPKWNCQGASLGGPGHEFINNVVYGHNPDNVKGGSVAGGSIKKNNALYNNGTGVGGGTNGGGGDYNYVYPVTGTIGTNAVTDPDPMFYYPQAADFRLKEGSPLIDSGTYVEYGEDFDGMTRPAGIRFDIGPYEFNGSGEPPPVDTTPPAPPAKPQISGPIP